MEDLQRQVATSADQLAIGLTLPVWDLDQQGITQILDRLMENPEVQEVAVTFHSGGLEPIVRSRPAGRAGVVQSEQRIVLSGEPLGQVRLVYTTQFTEASLRGFLRHSLWSLLGLDLLLVASLFLLLWWVVLQPLRELRKLAGLVSSGADVDLLPSRATYFGEFASVRQSLLRTFELLKRDIAARERSEAALQEREERYRSFFVHGPDGVVVLEPGTARILEFNDQACRQLDYSREAFQRLTVKDLDIDETEAESIQHIQRVMTLGSDDFMTRHRGRLGELHDVHVTAQAIQVGGASACHCVWRDVTQSRAMETERRQLQSQLQQAQKMESLGLLAGGVAHDMNNILGAILGLASAHIGSLPPGSPVRQALDTICKATDRGGRMVKSLLSFARQAPAEERELDLNEIIQEEIHLLERTTLARIQLEMRLADDLRPIRGDAGALTHALMNLCVNAVDAMPDGGTLSLQTRNLGLDWIEVRVQDTGIGMPREVLDKAMDPFFTTKDTGKGTGLGLSLAYSTVKAHRGQITLQSEPAAGTCVTLRFPACAAGPDVEAPAPAYAAPGLRGPLRVLLVDDDELVQSSIRSILEVLGHAPSSAQSGEVALAQLEAGYQPDLVILDMNMPGLGGAGTLPRLRALRPDLPVLLATGRTDQSALTLAAAHPGVTLLPKPFGLRELRSQLEALGLGG
jgi:PAS domain S-box-containing protein